MRIENEITSSNTIQKGKQQELWNPNRYGVLKRKSDYGSSPEHSAKKSSASAWQTRGSPPNSRQTSFLVSAALLHVSVFSSGVPSQVRAHSEKN